MSVPGSLAAQYFGRNKVQYGTFDFKIIQTEHFDVYYYDRERVAALDAARMAERGYARLSKVLNHEFKERKPIILYASSADFQQTNATDAGGESTGGVTDFARNRAVMPFSGSYSDFEHVLQHEMAHQFQYDIWSRGRAGAGLQTLIAIAPPLWFAEGMAEYLSLGPINPETAMWLRDASLEGKLPTIKQMTADPYEYFPYRFGHALWSYIGERWGDEAVGAILKATLAGGIEPAFRRTIGITLDQLSDQWRDAVQKRYLPEIGSRTKARAIADELLTKERSEGTLHLAPALSPDGSQVAYFSEKDFYSVDLYLADGVTGKVKRRILKSGRQQQLRDLPLHQLAGELVARREVSWPSPPSADPGTRSSSWMSRATSRSSASRLKLSGVTTPAWSPDGQQLVFTGLRRRTERSVHRRSRRQQSPAPDQRQVRRPPPGLVTRRHHRSPLPPTAVRRPTSTSSPSGNFRIGLYDLASGRIDVLDHMDQGKNVSPQWSPDGKSIAFVSDRNGVSNMFLYDLAEHDIYQLTDLYTGVQGITPLSPVLSWAHQADRLAFVYYEKGKFDVYSITNPRDADSAALQAGERATASVCWRGPPRRRSTPRGRCRCARTSVRRWARAVRSTGPRRASVRPAIWRTGPIPHGVAAADLDRRAARLRQLQPAGYERVHAQGLSRPFLARLSAPARPSDTPATTSDAASSAARPSR